MKSCKEFLDEIGLTYLWYAIKDSFISSNDNVTSGHVATWNSDGKSLDDSGFTIGKSVPSDALFTDTTYSAGSNISITGNNNAINALGYSWTSSNSTFAVTGQVNASGGFFQQSDIRKKNILGDLDLNKAYDLIDKCQTIVYTLKDRNQEQLGLIAQEVKEFFPEIVSEDENGYLSLDYSRLTVVILKVLKDLINRVSKLENYGNNN